MIQRHKLPPEPLTHCRDIFTQSAAMGFYPFHGLQRSGANSHHNRRIQKLDGPPQKCGAVSNFESGGGAIGACLATRIAEHGVGDEDVGGWNACNLEQLTESSPG